MTADEVLAAIPASGITREALSAKVGLSMNWLDRLLLELEAEGKAKRCPIQKPKKKGADWQRAPKILWMPTRAVKASIKFAVAIRDGSHYRTGKIAAERDRAEIVEYIKEHPGCKTFDIELELHHDRRTLDRHLRILRESGQIGNGWWAL